MYANHTHTHPILTATFRVKLTQPVTWLILHFTSRLLQNYAEHAKVLQHW